MKKTVSVLLLFVLLTATFSACGTTPAETTPVVPTPTTPVTTTPVATTPAPTTPTPTTPAPTTPVPTTPAPTTPAVTTPASTKPVVDASSPLTDALAAEIEATWRREKGRDLTWFDWDNIVTRHYGVIHLGSIGGYEALFACHGTNHDRHTLQLRPLPLYPIHTAGGIFLYKDNDFYSPQGAGFNYAMTKALYTRFKEIDEQIAQRPDLDDPYYYGSDHPPLGESPYTDEELDAWGIHPYGSYQSETGYLGTYNGYSAYVYRGNITGSHTYNFGGVCFELGEYSVYVCNGEEIHLLEDAYDLGLFSYDDLRAMAYYWYGERYVE